MRVESIVALDLKLGGGAWQFAEDERHRIAEHWREVAGRNPRLWNGEVLICTSAEIDRRVLTARFAVTDYASFVAWRDWGWPDRSVVNCFGAPAIMSSDAALVFGVMGAGTLNQGLLYPPSGSLEPRDVRGDGTVDVVGSIALELQEETGLDLMAAERGGLIAIFEGARLAVVHELRFFLSFGEIEARFQAHVAGQANPELARLEAIRSVSRIDSTMPGFAQEIVRYFFQGGGP